ncbi:MAG: TonB-dependent receptor [Alphaproteobacteria bacterium]|nr:TonB-dependent receptor [Alphaproteobacteria bacterium]
MASFTRLGLLSAVALPLALTSAPAFAQTQPAAQPAEGDIIVTARRTEERLQNVPIAVTALSAAALEAKGAENIGALQGSVPNLNIVQGRGTNSSANVFIRGVGQPDALQTFDPGVGIYLDDVYISRIRGALFDVYDVGRIEVLRGPQGTLYGKNTIGGAIKIVSKRPGDQLEGSASVTAGDFETLDLRARLAGPITDSLKGSVALYQGTRDGYVTNPTTGVKYNDKDTQAARGSLFWTPSDKLDVVLNVDYTKESPGLTLGKFENTLFRTNILPAVPGAITVLATPAAGEFSYKAEPTSTLPNAIKLEHSGFGLTASYKLSDNWTLKSITGARKLDSADYIDIDGTRFQLGDVFVGVRQDQISQEVQALYDGENFRLVSGVYGLRETMDSKQFAFGNDLFTVFSTPVTFRRPVQDSQLLNSYAAFAQGEWDLTDTLKLAVGVRSTRETKTYWRFTTTESFFASGPFVGLPVAGLNGLTVTFRDKASWQDVSPAATLTWTPSKDVTLYGKVSKGFKSGGFNGRTNGATEPRTFNPETLISTEAGAKTTWLDGKLVANLAVFHNEYEDFQARVSRGDTATATFGVLNAGKLEQNGAELEIAFRPVPAFGVNAQIGYLDASYSQFNDPNGRILATAASLANPASYEDRSWQEPAFSPEWTARVGADYKLDLGDVGSLTFNADANYKAETALTVDNANLLTRARFAGMFQEAYWLYNARIAYATPNDRYSLALIGRNLSDEAYRTDAQEFSAVAGTRTSYWGAPRTVLVQAGVKF